MIEEILEIAEVLESLVEDAPNKVKVELSSVIALIKVANGQEDLIKIQEQLEVISSMGNVNSYLRNEVYNAISIIESLI
ncbi:MAG: hypothetical protein PF569_04355 [Candidatus Woesearchaeota archaeon]|jgi:uncharacterized protein (UPF0147 family)|nr:hypothetical protein [Candidatus Woesearchaeota archaeon]